MSRKFEIKNFINVKTNIFVGPLRDYINMQRIRTKEDLSPIRSNKREIKSNTLYIINLFYEYKTMSKNELC